MYSDDGSRLQRRAKGNLIVGPLSVLEQWKREIETKGCLSAPLKCAIYAGSNREFRAYDVS